MNLKRIGLIAALLAVLLSAANAQEVVKTPVAFECKCEDNGGRLYRTAFLDLVATSPRYTQTSTSDGVKNFKITVVSADPSSDKGGHMVSIAVVFTWGEMFLDVMIQSGGTGRTKGMAEDTLAAFDADVQQLNAAAPKRESK
jgi:hypothetical protein